MERERKRGGREERRGWWVNTKEGGLPADGTGLFVGKELLVEFVGGEADGHLRYNAGEDSS